MPVLYRGSAVPKGFTSNTLPLGGSEFENNECKDVTELKDALWGFTV